MKKVLMKIKIFEQSDYQNELYVDLINNSFQLDEEQARKISSGNYGFRVIKNAYLRQSRWYLEFELILYHIETGLYFMTQYTVGSTES